jgi:hypothetical protein
MLDLSLNDYIELLANVCHRWNESLYAAMQIGRTEYGNLKWSVMAQIERMRQSLSEVAPLCQRQICPPLVSSFANRIMSHFNRMRANFDQIILEEEGLESLCVAMFRAVLTDKLSEYPPEITARRFTQDLVIQSLNRVTGLVKLRLPRVHGVNRSAQVATSISFFRSLEVFEYEEHCTDAVVMQLGLNCTCLTELSLLYSNAVTNDSVIYLLLLINLQFLNVCETQIDSTRYGFILSQLPKIADIRFANKEDDVLLHIARETLDTITHVYGFIKDFHLQIETFPKTTNFVVNAPDLDMSELTAWTELRTLDITRGLCPTFNMNAILAGIGHRLTALKLSDVTSVDLHDIVTLCESLETLFLVLCLIVPLDADAPLDPELPHFRNLKSLKIESMQHAQMDYSFIRYYVSLQKIDLTWVNVFTVEFMTEVVTRGTLRNLRECCICETKEGSSLNFEVLQLLIQHCPHLKVFGVVRFLHQLDSNSIEQLKGEMRAQNFDLTIK